MQKDVTVRDLRFFGLTVGSIFAMIGIVPALLRNNDPRWWAVTLGVLLIILPWTPRWTDNPLLLTSPNLRDFVSSGFVRGLASGLGILDLWLGFWEAIHYH